MTENDRPFSLDQHQVMSLPKLTEVWMQMHHQSSLRSREGMDTFDLPQHRGRAAPTRCGAEVECEVANAEQTSFGQKHTN